MVPALILTAYGGEVVLDGVTVRGLDTNRAPITSGAQVHPISDAIPRRPDWAVPKSTTAGLSRSPAATHERSSEERTVCSRTPRIRPCGTYSTGSSPRHPFAEPTPRTSRSRAVFIEGSSGASVG